MKIYINLDTLQLIAGLGVGKTIDRLEFKRGDAATLQVQFLDGGVTPVKLTAGTALNFIIKPEGNYDGAALVLCSVWQSPTAPTDFTYLCSPSFNTTSLNAALVGNAPSTAAIGEITWQLGVGAPTTTKTFAVTVFNDLYRDSELSPTVATPDYPLPGSLLTLANVGVTVAAKAHSHTAADLPPVMPPGYIAGQGGAVVQATSKSTGVTLDAPSGQITLEPANLPAATAVAFTLTNAAIAATDVVAVAIKGGSASPGAYLAGIDSISAGACRISLRNLTAGDLAEAVVLQYAIIKGSNS